ncbi:DUF1223 domain-containing protein [Rhodobaculum claviforme]|uniref:DUF1223 domain-containing protein n=1 Tax=Rhodobaculum claviforme TaxID=1549854 RepID=UPI001F5C7DF0|nr:DUF1223 domain-containing protein [Rhodobaculum claviforme]
MAAPAPAAAETIGEPGVVVELFTSQGCVACPPADALLARLADRPGVIALSLHVDIWDYLGWADRFADPAFTRRQKAYARAEGSRSIFTPQMIVGGVHRIVGSAGMDLADRLTQEAGRPARVGLELRRDGGMLHIAATAEPPLERSVTIDMVRYTPSATMMISGGENAGREVTHHNIVTLWDQIATWDGQTPLALHVRLEGAEPAVVIIQEAGPGRILAASRAR